MADALLHIKDSYYFDVPKMLWPCRYTDKSQFPEVWIRLDSEYQHWEAHRLIHELDSLPKSPKFAPPSGDHLLHEWEHWQHGDHANHGKPFAVFLEEGAEKTYAEFVEKNGAEKSNSAKFDEFLGESKSEFAWFASLRFSPEFKSKWQAAKASAGDVKAFCADKSTEWSAKKLQGYNYHLSGKVLVPQVFGGKLRNFYEAESGFCLSKFMILELVAATILCLLFIWLGNRVRSGAAPRGKLWNFLELFLVFIRDQIARPAIGGHHDDLAHESHEATAHSAGGHADAAHLDHGQHAAAHAAHGGHAHSSSGASSSAHENPADRFVPLLWTIFWFVLVSNLLGMLPWLGAPTGSWAVTLGMAVVTFTTVVFSGMKKFGFLGFFKNQVPGMSLPLPLALLLIPMIFAIEIVGLFIKHAVLSVRLLANMVAGHLVILGIMGLAFSPEGAASSMWPITAVIAVVSAAAFNLLELFVAFLQAYIFTFLSALFIGASVHKH